jgi:CheY-like chemotaxis protein
MDQASIFLVEDEAFIQMMLIEMLEELGHRVVAVASSVDEARSLAEIEEYDLAILDINLQGLNVQPVAEVVAERKLPFFFLTGYGAQGVPDGFEEAPVLSKPCAQLVIERTIDSLLSTQKTKVADAGTSRT